MEQNFINDLINRRTNVRVYTTNGFQLRGRILEQNANAIVMKVDKVERLIYKHAISTIEPITE